MTEQSFMLLIHPADEGGYWAELPSLPGCFVQGETVDELIAHAPDVVASHVTALREDGQRIPNERIFVTWVRTKEEHSD